MRAPLAGLKVIDFTHVMSGPFCTYILGLLGARVIKVERRGEGDVMRQYDHRPEYAEMAPPFQAINAGKESVALDLKKPQGLALARKLIGTADIVVENFRPGVLEKLGLGYVACRDINSEIIYCSVTGFGQTGPLKNNPAYDHVVQAMCGVMSLTGDPDGQPMKVGFPMVDTFSGYAAACAILSAVLSRARFGGGSYIDLAMLDSALLLQISMAAPFLIAGDVPQRVGNRGFNASPTAATFEAADGPILLGANTQKQFHSMCEVIGACDIARDERFSTPESRIENAEDLLASLRPLFLARPAEEWEALLNAASVPAAAIRTIPQAISHPHVQGRHLAIPFEAPAGGKAGHTLGLGFPVDNGNSGTLTAPPRLGQHTVGVLEEVGLSNQEIKALQSSLVI